MCFSKVLAIGRKGRQHSHTNITKLFTCLLFSVHLFFPSLFQSPVPLLETVSIRNKTGGYITQLTLPWGGLLDLLVFFCKGCIPPAVNLNFYSVAPSNVAWIVGQTETSHVSIHFTKRSGPSRIHLSLFFLFFSFLYCIISCPQDVFSVVSVAATCSNFGSYAEPWTLLGLNRNCPCNHGSQCPGILPWSGTSLARPGVGNPKCWKSHIGPKNKYV